MVSKINIHNNLIYNSENIKLMQSKIESQEKDSKFEILDIYSQSSENKNANYTNDLKNSITNFENSKNSVIATSSKKELSSEELEEIKQLKAIDAKVKAHESAHLASAGNLAQGGANFTYQIGPDGKHYAIGGEVQISLASSENADETIKNMKAVQAAALAPSDPSSQDIAVAQKAAKIEAEAYSEKIKTDNEIKQNHTKTQSKEEVTNKLIQSNQYFAKAINKYIQGQGNIPIGKS